MATTARLARPHRLVLTSFAALALVGALADMARGAGGGRFPAEVELSRLLDPDPADGPVGVVLDGVADGDQTGRALAFAGDVNGDGLDDLIVGADGATPDGRSGAGRAFVVFGRGPDPLPTPLDLAALLAANGGDGSAGFVVNGAASGDAAGWSVSAAGDINGDGVHDLLIGAVGADPDQRGDAGTIYVLFGRRVGFPPEIDLASLLAVNGGDGTIGFAVHGVDPGDRAGSSLAAAGDVNGDGIDDIVIGAPDAGFTVADRIVSDPGDDLPSPEFDPVADRMVWQDRDNNLWVARVDSVTGAITPRDGRLVQVDSGLAPFGAVGNTPRVVYGEEDVLVYTKTDGDTLSLAAATSPAPGVWQLQPLENADDRYRIEGTPQEFDGVARIAYNRDTPDGNTVVSYRTWNDAGSEGTAQARGQGARFLGTEPFVLTLTEDPALPARTQLTLVDINTDIGEQITDGVGSKLNPFVWFAPEYNDYVIVVLLDFLELAFYRRIEGEWTLFNQFAIPSDLTCDPPETVPDPPVGVQPVPCLSSPEAFVVDGRSYVAVVATEALGIGDAFPGQPSGASEIWVAGVDADAPFFREVSNPQTRRRRAEPEPYLLESGAYIYFTESVPDTSPTQRLLRLAATGLPEGGESYVLFGRREGFPAEVELSSLLAVNDGDGSAGYVLRGVGDGDRAGVAVGAAGDVDNDGKGDVLLGADLADPAGRENAGQAYVTLGRTSPGPAEINLRGLLSENGGDGSGGFTITGAGTADAAGSSVASLTDFNGDGRPDLITSAPFADADGATDVGQAYVLLGNRAQSPAERDLIDLFASEGGDGSDGLVLRGIDVGDAAGSATASAGDLDQDGLTDVVVGAPFADPGQRAEAGEAYVVYGQPTADLPAEFALADLQTGAGGDGSKGFVIRGIAPGDQAGSAAAGTGDVNGDGFTDLLVGAPGAGPIRAGQAYLLLGGCQAIDDLDTDDDGIADGDEDRNANLVVDEGETDPCAADTDGDGVQDGTELGLTDGLADPDGESGPLRGTDPSRFIPDTDPDSTSDPLLGDTDADGLGDALESIDGACPFVRETDSDGDGRLDGEEDADADGRRDDNETDPCLDDTDLDGLLDDTESLDGTCPFALDADSDDDGIADGDEDSNGNGRVDIGETDPCNPDTDGDDVQDGTELGLTVGVPDPDGAGSLLATDAAVFEPDADPETTSDPTRPDTDGDGLPDGLESRPDVCSAVDDADTDDDGLPDGDEDANGDGQLNAGETNPCARDTDGDGLADSLERQPGVCSLPDDADSDDDGLADGSEDSNGNGQADAGESDLCLADTDGDGLQDGTELGLTQGLADPDGDAGPLLGTDPSRFIADTDPDSVSNPLLADTDGDLLGDALESINGACPFADDIDSDDDGLADGSEDINLNGVVDTGETDPCNADTDMDMRQDGTEQGLVAGLEDPDGDEGPLTGTDLTVFIADDNPQTQTDPLAADTDGDGLGDGQESVPGACLLADDLDTDDDGLADNEEDRNLNGVVDAGETDPCRADTDDDGLQDGTELGRSAGVSDPDGDTGPIQATDAARFVRDRDPASTSDPLNPDTDGDGLRDGIEGDGTACTFPTDIDSDDDGLADGVEDANGNDRLDAGETAACNPDTDGDGLQDGTELGLTAGLADPDGRDGPLTATDPALFIADTDPDSVSDPTTSDTDGDQLADGVESVAGACPFADDLDSDDDGLPDGVEDANLDGVLDPGETDPCDADTDGDGQPDGAELGLTAGVADPDGDGPLSATNADTFVPDPDPDTITDPLDPTDFDSLDEDGGGEGSGSRGGGGAVSPWLLAAWLALLAFRHRTRARWCSAAI